MVWTIRGTNSGTGKEFLLHHNVQSDSGAHPASYSVFSGGCFLGSNGQGIRLKSFLSSAKIKNELDYTSSQIIHIRRA